MTNSNYFGYNLVQISEIPTWRRNGKLYNSGLLKLSNIKPIAGIKYINNFNKNLSHIKWNVFML